MLSHNSSSVPTKKLPWSEYKRGFYPRQSRRFVTNAAEWNVGENGAESVSGGGMGRSAVKRKRKQNGESAAARFGSVQTLGAQHKRRLADGSDCVFLLLDETGSVQS